MTTRAGGGGPDDVRGGRAGTAVTEHRTARRAVRWFSWIIGLAMLAAVIIAALHFSEEREMLRIADGVSRPVVMASVVVDAVSHYAAYVLPLALALVITVVLGHPSPLIFAAAAIFAVFSASLIAAALVLSGRKSMGPKWLGRIPLLKNVLALLREAEPRLARSFPLIFKSSLFQLAIVLLDAATVWILILSLGEPASPTGVFASFMISTLLRTISIVPGGLGVFEAASVLTLKLAGVPVPVALAATMLFRGLSFWLPMVPGLIFSRDVRKEWPA
jgi:Mg2+-importing ATPase